MNKVLHTEEYVSFENINIKIDSQNLELEKILIVIKSNHEKISARLDQIETNFSDLLKVSLNKSNAFNPPNLN